jgi:hypothetical protein
MMAACARAEAEGISCEIIDLATIMPWDMQTVRDSVLKTGRVGAPGLSPTPFIESAPHTLSPEDGSSR